MSGFNRAKPTLTVEPMESGPETQIRSQVWIRLLGFLLAGTGTWIGLHTPWIFVVPPCLVALWFIRKLPPRSPWHLVICLFTSGILSGAFLANVIFVNLFTDLHH